MTKTDFSKLPFTKRDYEDLAEVYCNLRQCVSHLKTVARGAKQANDYTTMVTDLAYTLNDINDKFLEMLKESERA